MAKMLTVVPELCSGCGICELICAITHFGANNPKKSAVRVLVTYPHPVMRLPVVCGQCKVPICADACPVGAIRRIDGVVRLSHDDCISCMKCVEACPFGAMFAHTDVPHPIKCDLCDGHPQCVDKCPKGAIRFIPEQSLGEAKRMNNVLSYTHMKEIRYAEIGTEEL